MHDPVDQLDPVRQRGRRVCRKRATRGADRSFDIGHISALRHGGKGRFGRRIYQLPAKRIRWRAPPTVNELLSEMSRRSYLHKRDRQKLWV